MAVALTISNSKSKTVSCIGTSFRSRSAAIREYDKTLQFWSEFGIDVSQCDYSLFEYPNHVEPEENENLRSNHS